MKMISLSSNFVQVFLNLLCLVC